MREAGCCTVRPNNGKGKRTTKSITSERAYTDKLKKRGEFSACEKIKDAIGCFAVLKFIIRVLILFIKVLTI